MTVKAEYSVSSLNGLIKEYIDNLPVLRGISVRGEISNLKVYQGSGHLYFTLKDEGSSIKAVMFGGAGKLDFKPENGMMVICAGRVSVFPRDGVYQFYADGMEPDGTGSLYIAFEKLKAKLESEGLFSSVYKKKLPKIPFCVGIITAPTGAAVRDMINVSRRRFPAARIIIYPSAVQGDTAPAQLTGALKQLDASGLADVIIIGRGGGSIEDLWAFNSEPLARAIFACKTPVISAVGHETDFTIADFVADLRAPTPSAAAELALPDKKELLTKFTNVQKRMNGYIIAKTEGARRHFELISDRPVLKNALAPLAERRSKLWQLGDRLARAPDFAPLAAEGARLGERLRSIAGLTAERAGRRVSVLSEKLSGLNPLGVLERGYSVAFDTEGRIIKSISSLAPGSDFTLRLADGEAVARATETRAITKKESERNGG